MALSGQGAMVAWHNLQPGSESAHDDWHSREHLFERVSITGFRRGRRCRAIRAEEEYFLMYEVDDLATLTSPAYLARLNDPTAWSQQIIPTITDMTRTLCRISVSCGAGVGNAILTVRFAAEADHRADLAGWLIDHHVPALHTHTGIVGVHLLTGDAAASGMETDEMRRRGGADHVADLVLLVESYELPALQSLLPTAVDALRAHGASAPVTPGIYRPMHVVSETDLPVGQ